MPAVLNRRTHYYAELAVSSLAVAAIIAITHCTYPRRDGQAELAWINTQVVYPRKVVRGHRSQY